MAKITLNVRIASSLGDKLVGLIKNPHQSMFFQTRFGLHTFFMKKPIDIVVLDKNCKVVSLKENLKPWKVYFWNPKYNFVLELPKGYIKNLNLKKDDRLLLK